MSNLAEAVQTQAYLEAGYVVTSAPLMVDVGGRRRRARRAPACLIEPQPNDRVLIALCSDESFVISVLERDELKPAEIELPYGLDLRVASGRFRVAAQDGVDITTVGNTKIVSGKLEVTAVEGGLFVQRLRLLAGTVDTVAERISQKVQRAYRFVAGLDQLRAGIIDAKAKSFARLHAKDNIVTADKLVKVDGEQIHVG